MLEVYIGNLRIVWTKEGLRVEEEISETVSWCDVPRDRIAYRQSIFPSFDDYRLRLKLPRY